MKPEQVMLLTQGVGSLLGCSKVTFYEVLPLGGSHPVRSPVEFREMHEVVTRLLNFWAQLLAGAEKAKAPVLPADDLAQLAMLLSMAGL